MCSETVRATVHSVLGARAAYRQPRPSPVEDVEVSVAREEVKFAAVILCLQDGGHTIRSARECATKYTPIGEKMTKEILRALLRRGYVAFDTKLRRWVWTADTPKLRTLEEAIAFVVKTGLRRY